MTKHVRTTKPGHAMTYTGGFVVDNVGVDVPDATATAIVARAVELGIVVVETDVAAGRDRGLIPGVDTGWRVLAEPGDTSSNDVWIRRASNVVEILMDPYRNWVSWDELPQVPLGFRLSAPADVVCGVHTLIGAEGDCFDLSIDSSGNMATTVELATGAFSPYGDGRVMYLTSDDWPDTMPGTAVGSDDGGLGGGGMGGPFGG